MDIKRSSFMLLALAVCGGPLGEAAAHGSAGAFQGRSTAQAAAPQPVIVAPDSQGPGIERLLVTVPAREASKGGLVQTLGQLVPDPAAVVDVNTYVSGEIRQVLVRPGQRVAKGALLATIYSPEFVLTQRSYLALLSNEEKLSTLREEGRLPNYMQDAVDNLKWWGLSEADIQALQKSGRIREELPVVAPEPGIVTEVFVQPGSLVNAGDRTMKDYVVMGRSLARMVSTRLPLRVEGYFFPDMQGAIREGVLAQVRLGNGRSLERRISQVLPSLDEKTRRGRFVVPLGGAVPGAIGEVVQVNLKLGRSAGVWVPRDAVLGQHLTPLVYVQRGGGRYERRPVRVLSAADGWLQVAGVRSGERVVVGGKMLLEGVYRMSAGGQPQPRDDHHH
ncbi:MAG: efflux RND transporter periplasmic adaptor subunit [Pseudomonadota bacterium]|uniref:efflux RND transporter periplasmic adaptor subunit n=1 Tax=Thermithiobacillus tepidarius TaxID=929 RepID=UPI0012DCD26B|nr:efflux RND transporter periplasmic adaptor subunit [Thermithiobacillus tepidarius]